MPKIIMNVAAGVIFIISAIVVFIYGNFLMINRPHFQMPQEGFMYPMWGKGAVIYISSQDWTIIGFGLFGIIISLILSKVAHSIRK